MFIYIGSSYNLNNKNIEQPVVVNNIPVSRTDTHKCKGAQMDKKLSWDSHIVRKARAAIGAMRRIREPFVPVDTLEKVYKSLVQPYFGILFLSLGQVRKITKRQATKISISCC